MVRRTLYLSMIVVLLAAGVTPVAWAQSQADSTDGAGGILQATLVVNSDQDHNIGRCTGEVGYECTLRRAISEANFGDTIVFAGDYSIYLFNPLTIRKPLTIDGSGREITVSGDTLKNGSPNVRVFEIIGPEADVTLSHISIVSGTAESGGGIYIDEGTLTVLNSTLAGNSATSGGGGGIRNRRGTLTVINSTLAGNSAIAGGGISIHEGTLTVRNSTISGNSATGGGGISATGTLSVINSALLGNSATDRGGGISLYASTLTVLNSTLSGNSATDGGGIDNYDSTLTVRNSTLSGNSATTGGGIYARYRGTLTMLNSTLSGNSATTGGGIFNSAGYTGYGTLTVRNSTLSGNSATTGGGIFNAQYGNLNYAATIIANSSSGGDCVNASGGTIGTNSHNLVQDGSCGAALSGDPVLGPLADNGGDTLTHALLAGSPAIDAVPLADCTLDTDQRGVARPQPTGGSCDIGAFEWACSDAVKVRNANDSGAGSLRQAILEICPGGRIDFAADYTIYLDTTLVIDNALTIDASGHKITVSGDSGNDGSPDVRVLEIGAGAVVTLSHISIVSGTAAYGGGVRNDGTLTLTHSTLSANSAVWGGGIENRGALTVLNSTLSANSATTGGGINNAGTLTVLNSTLSANSATTGGGIRNTGTLNYASTIIASSSGGDCLTASGGTIGTNSFNLVQDGSCGAALSGDPLLGPLAGSGGDSLTHALLPGSPAIDAVPVANCTSATDQRGVARPQGAGCDIGAYESRGWTLTQGGGSDQVTFLYAPFLDPLTLTVSSAYGEPVDGGRVLFAGPAGGAGITPITHTATIAGGAASVMVTANGTQGSYSVVAGARGAAPQVSFALTNTGTVYCEPLSAVQFSCLPSTPRVSETVTWSAQANGSAPITFAWDLGDGATASGAVVTHSYSATGPYTVTLTAANTCSVQVHTRDLTVQPAAYPVYLPLATRSHGGYNVAGGVRLRPR